MIPLHPLLNFDSFFKCQLKHHFFSDTKGKGKKINMRGLSLFGEERVGQIDGLGWRPVQKEMVKGKMKTEEEKHCMPA